MNMKTRNSVSIVMNNITQQRNTHENNVSVVMNNRA